MSEIKIYNGDCLEIMKDIPDKSVDLILTDPPYGTTAHKWDNVIPFKLVWEQCNRIIKDNGIIALFATQPFTSMLICSNINEYRYSWIWKKESPNGFLNSAYAPLKITEDIVIFSKGTVGSVSKNPIRFYPNGIKDNGIKKNNPNSKFRKQNGYNGNGNVLNSDKEYSSKTGFPNNILSFSRDKNSVHPTQKPVALLEYLIETYTNENELVLDFTMGSGSTGVACKNLNRCFIGIELNEKYFEIAKQRIENEFIIKSDIENTGIELF